MSLSRKVVLIFFTRIADVSAYVPRVEINSDENTFQLCFSTVQYLKISEQRWFSSERRWKRKHFQS